MSARAATILVVLGALALAPITAPAPVGAAVVPLGFTDTSVAAVGGPTALAFTPDGRMLVTTKSGQLFVRRNGVMATTPSLDLSSVVCTESERGLLGVAVDPAFATNGFVYLYYTHENGSGACPTGSTSWPANRVARFVLGADDTIASASEVVLFDGIPSVAGNHNGGDLGFGPDGMLYVSVGDGGCDYAAMASCGGANDASRDVNVALGKILRISPVDGSAPVDNPFVGSQDACGDDGFTTAASHCPETFAWGLRNPFRMSFAADGRLYVNDVGQGAWEEIDDVQAAKDYGWNQREGRCVNGSTTNCPVPPTGLTDPIFSYGRTDGCRSITGSAFAPASWPEAYRGDYLFADYACGKIFRLEGTTRVDLATGLGANTAVHMEVGPDDAVYYTTFGGGGEVRRLAPPATPPPGGTWLSDVAPLSATNGYGPYERDMSNGGSAGGDGRPIRLNGVTASKGLGVHATSTLTYPVGGATTFTAEVGVDDECGASGTVVFQVLIGGVVKYDSGVMAGSSPTKTVTVDLGGATQVVLRVTNGGDGYGCDHADWANARLLATSPTTTSPPPSTSPTTAPPVSTVPPTTPTTPSTTAPPAGTYVSGLTPRSATNGYGPYERNQSNGGPAAGDGRPIRLNGVVATKGLGVHATSTIVYLVPTGSTAFRANVGVDDECGAAGSVVFQVLVNGVKKFDSSVMRATSPTKAVAVPVVGGNTVSLRVTNAGDGYGCDHADWANARFT